MTYEIRKTNREVSSKVDDGFHNEGDGTEDEEETEGNEGVG